MQGQLKNTYYRRINGVKEQYYVVTAPSIGHALQFLKSKGAKWTNYRTVRRATPTLWGKYLFINEI